MWVRVPPRAPLSFNNDGYFGSGRRIKAEIAKYGLENFEKKILGTCWVTNGVKPIKIKKEELEQYLLAGWSKGRKILTTD